MCAANKSRGCNYIIFKYIPVVSVPFGLRFCHQFGLGGGVLLLDLLAHHFPSVRAAGQYPGNIKGQLVKTLVHENQKADYYSELWDGTDASGQKVGSGVYLYHVQSGKHHKVFKMTLIR